MKLVEVTPILYVKKKRGIKGVDANKIPPRTWFLINEAVYCFRNAEYEACIAILISCMEVWLRTEVRSQGLTPKVHLRNLIDQAVPTILSSEEAQQLHKLREVRNKLLHSEVDWLAKMIGQVTDTKTGRGFSLTERLRGDLGKDLSVFLRVPLDALVHLRYAVNLLQKRYGSKDPESRYIYYTGHISQIGNNRFDVEEQF